MFVITRKLVGRSLLGVAVVISMACAMLGSGASAVEDATADVLAANAQFYAALNQMFTGDASLIQAVWSHADDVTYMGPTGRFVHGWIEVNENWESQAALRLGGKIDPADMVVVAGQDLAVVSCYEVGENTNADGQVQQVRLRATNIFRKEEGVWKMIGHHTDTLPYLAQ